MSISKATQKEKSIGPNPEYQVQLSLSIPGKIFGLGEFAVLAAPSANCDLEHLIATADFLKLMLAKNELSKEEGVSHERFTIPS
jgi:hypothetical protein